MNSIALKLLAVTAESGLASLGMDVTHSTDVTHVLACLRALSAPAIP